MTNRILIVASDNLVLVLLKRIINNNISNCTVKTYSRFSKSKFEEDSDFQIMIVDGHITGSSGFEIINYLRFTLKKVNKIIFLGYSESENNKALMMGANHVISKPIPVDDFVTLIKDN